MPESLEEFFSSASFMPHGHCYLWKPALVWLQVLSNGGIALAYISIFLTLVYLVRRIRDMPFQWMYSAFAVFIVACGITHVMDVYVIWEPAYWIDGAVRGVTAVASISTALLLPPLVPKAVALAEAAAVSHDRGIKLEQANKNMAVLLDRSKELEQLKSAFFANVSHELRTPLALILGPVEKLLSSSNLSDEQRRDLELVSRNARSLLDQVDDLLDVAKLEAGKLEPDYVDADLAELARLTAAQFEPLAVERRIAYHVHAPATLAAQLDPEKMERVLLNLITNAFKFTPKGGTIRCEVRTEKSGSDEETQGAETAVIEVSDSGPGIPVEHRQAVFERFRQLDGGTTRRFGGTGLGLAIAKDFTELHRGRITISDAPEGGAQFRVELPLSAPAGAKIRTSRTTTTRKAELAAERIAVELTEPSSARQPADGAEMLVLVVEDNPDLNRFLCELLSTDHRVASAQDGEEGLRLAREICPDLILTDMMMPRLSGEDLLRAVRSHPQLAHVPVVVLTAKGEDDLRVRVLREGAQDYLLKPFSAEEVRARIMNLLAMKRAGDVLRAELQTNARDVATLAQDIAQRQRELKTALGALAVARDQALHASEAKTNFLGLVSHELRTPLTTLRLRVDRLMESSASGTPERHRQALLKLDSGCRRLEHIVNSLLEHARIQSGRLHVRSELTSLAEIVDSAVDELRPQAEERRLSIESNVTPEPSGITTDKDLLRLALVNLIANGIKFTEQGGVRVEAGVAGGVATIRVIDTGPGIPLEEQTRIFEPFHQLEEVRHKHTPGVGLGLALVRELVHALGGEVHVQSEVGRGSTFTLTIPLYVPHLVQVRSA